MAKPFINWGSGGLRHREAGQSPKGQNSWSRRRDTGEAYLETLKSQNIIVLRHSYSKSDTVCSKPRFSYLFLMPYSSSRPLRSSNHLFLTVPQPRLMRKGECAFAVAAAKLWNNLPLSVKLWYFEGEPQNIDVLMAFEALKDFPINLLSYILFVYTHSIFIVSLHLFVFTLYSISVFYHCFIAFFVNFGLFFKCSLLINLTWFETNQLMLIYEFNKLLKTSARYYNLTYFSLQIDSERNVMFSEYVPYIFGHFGEIRR